MRECANGVYCRYEGACARSSPLWKRPPNLIKAKACMSDQERADLSKAERNKVAKAIASAFER